MPYKILAEESTKDILAAGIGGASLALVSMSDINLIINLLAGFGVLILTWLRIFSWFERRRKRKLDAEEE